MGFLETGPPSQLQVAPKSVTHLMTSYMLSKESELALRPLGPSADRSQARGLTERTGSRTLTVGSQISHLTSLSPSLSLYKVELKFTFLK